MSFEFNEVSLLITVYNRSSSLERLLSTFNHLNIFFGEIIVSDDGSREEHVLPMLELQKIYNFNLVRSLKNKGLGNNINKGQASVTKPFTVYIQEDFVPSDVFGYNFEKCLKALKTDDRLDVVRFYGYFNYPYTKPYDELFSELVFKPEPWYTNHLKFYMYSDHPHLRRSSFTSKFGNYSEGIKGDLMELYMSFSFIKNKGRVLLLKDLTLMIDQKNSSDEPTTMIRNNWKEDSKMITILRSVYLKFRLLKNTMQLLSFKPSSSKINS